MEDRKKKAFDILWETRETLLKYLADDVVEKEAVLKGKTNYEGALGFDYQEIDNKFMGRLASINTFLHNLTSPAQSSGRRPAVKNRVEVVITDPADLEKEINDALKRHTALKLVGTAMREIEGGKLVVLLSFTSP